MGGGTRGTHTPTPVTQSVQISFDPTAAAATNVRVGTSATTGQTLTLPAGAIPISIMTVGGATGGTNPTVNIGTAADPDGLFAAVDADTAGTLAGAGGALAVAGGLAADATVTGIVGSSAATGGTFTGILTYVMANNSVE
tara:strand:- start:330 stop:749 length:420 start_codon:yes stop_codon:yes gene_type:complete